MTGARPRPDLSYYAAPEIAGALHDALDLHLRPFRAGGGTLPQGLRLYRWNNAVAAAFFEVLATVELAVRVAVDHQLSTLASDGRWWDSPWWLDQDPARRGDLDRALAKAAGTRDRRAALLARLPFGFWPDLLAPRRADDLWEPALRHGFPGLPAGAGPAAVHDPLRRLAALRNRIAHHEPVHDEPLGSLHDDVLDVLAAVCPVTAAWTERTSRVPALLAQDPRRLPEPGPVAPRPRAAS